MKLSANSHRRTGLEGTGASHSASGPINTHAASTPRRRLSSALMASAIALMAAGGVHAQETAAAVVPTESAMVKLIRGLISSGTLAADVGEALLAQAQAEALAAQQAQQQAQQAAAATPRVQPQIGDVRVPYVSQTTRDQIRDEVKSEVLAQAKAENWAAPNAIPDWTQRIQLEGDVRVRNESRFYAEDNSNIEVDWARINEGSGYDTNLNTNLENPPFLNLRQDRKNIWRVRARLGVLANVSDSVKAGVRIATGSDDNPVSANQSLGNGMSKKDIWLDRAWVSYAPWSSVTLTAGRFGNPFVSTDMLYSGDLNFDGVTLKLDTAASKNALTWFGTLGMIPLEYSSDSFPLTSMDKSGSHNRWLLAAQAGADWKFADDNRLRAALAYYDFRNVRGKVSQPCELYSGKVDHCSTDWSRPAYMQRGNTLMYLRDVALDPLDPAYTETPQYVGLASQFRLLDLNLRWDARLMGDYHMRLEANYIRNLAYDEQRMWDHARIGIYNNFREGIAGPTSANDLESGPNAYLLQATFGDITPKARHDANVFLGYKRIEPDAMPDGFNDSSFHLGGTNARGYFVGASYALDDNAWISGRWMPTQEVYGPPVKVDTLQIDFNVRF